jgi:hypothetical protein
MPAGTNAAQPSLAQSQPPPRTSHQPSTDSAIVLVTQKGSAYFNKVKGLPAVTCALPKTSPLSKDAPLFDNIELLRVHIITWFSGVDLFKTILEDFAHLNDETHVFTSVWEG